MPWREGIGTPFNLSSGGVSENHTTEEFSSDQQVEGLDDILREVNIIGDSVLNVGNFDATSEVSRVSDIDSWSQAERPDALEDTSVSDAARRVALTQSISNFFDRHAHHEPASEEPLQSSDAFARIVAHSIVGQSSANIPSMPWETGPMRSIFMNDDVTQNLTVPIQNSFHASEVDSREVVGSLPSVVGSVATTQSHEVSMTSQSIANLKDKDFFERQTELKQLAVDKWLSIVRNHTLSSEVGQQI